MKRFWQQAEAAPQGDAWQVLLDGKPVRLPGGAALLLPHRTLASAVAEEWQAAGNGFTYDDVPLTRLAGTAQARVAAKLEPVALELARYGESDLLCYRAEQPPALVQRQQQEWQPWLDWAAQAFGARLMPTARIIHRPQDPRALAALTQAVAEHDTAGLTALGIIVPALGSLVLGLALTHDRLDAAEAHALATLDERFQEELWGRDDEAITRRARIGTELATAARFLTLSRASESAA